MRIGKIVRFMRARDNLGCPAIGFWYKSVGDYDCATVYIDLFRSQSVGIFIRWQERFKVGVFFHSPIRIRVER